MAAVESQRKKNCVSPSRILKLEKVVKDLDLRLKVVEESLFGMDGMRARMFQLEKSMENALDRIMPRLDALLSGLPASTNNPLPTKPQLFRSFSPIASPAPCCSPIQPLPSSNTVSVPTANSSPTPSTHTTSTSGSSTSCPVCLLKRCTCASRSVTSLEAASAKSSGASCDGTAITPAGAKAAASAQKSNSVRSTLHKSIASEEKSTVQPVPTQPADSELEKQLREAAANGDVILCQKLVLQGVDAKKRDLVTGDTPLHCASRGGHLGCIMMLLAVAKSTVVITNKQHQTPLMIAAANGHVAAVQLLLHQCKPCWSNKQLGGKALRLAASQGRDEIVRALLEGAVSPNQEEKPTGPSPLQAAATNGHVICVLMLIEKGADVSYSDSDGQTALHKAAMNGHGECVAALLGAGANPLDKDASGWEPLHLAARAGHIECVKLLLASGVDVNRPAANGETPLPNECPEKALIEKALLEKGLIVAKTSIEEDKDDSLNGC